MSSEKFRKTLIKIFVGLFLAVLGIIWSVFCLFLSALYGFIVISPFLFFPLVLIGWLGGLMILISAFRKHKKDALIGAAIIAGAIICLIAGSEIERRIDWETRRRYEVVKANINEREYRPFSEGNKLVTPTLPVPARLTGALPKLNGAYALYPVYAAVVQAIYPDDRERYWDVVGTTGSDSTFRRLNDGSVDLIFGGAPSQAQLKEAEDKGIHYEMTPFGREAFVFFVNKENPISNLSSEQIRGIYSGKITDWRELGAPDSEEIVAYQRNEGSGSQTMLEKIMGDTPIADAPKERISDGMGSIIQMTAEYRNKNSAIGFSFRFYTQELMKNDKLKLLSIDGIAPTKENIENGTYPFVTDFYMISSRGRSANTKKVVDFLLSPAGREIVEKTGYTPIKNNPR